MKVPVVFMSTVPVTVMEAVKFPSRASCPAAPGSAQACPASRVTPAPPNSSSSGFAPSGLTAWKPTRKPRLCAVARGCCWRLAERRPVPPCPGTTPPDPMRARCRTLRIGLGTGKIIRLPVVDPFPHISVHVIKAPRVGGKLADIHGLLGIIAIIMHRHPSYN